ncbi:MAG: rhomboid family intramembrane serine protease [Bacteroidales bacterium]|jgi:membrane associated rhomboid family serine protease|nr:rhomboid family intramembrane serine protease [Bacteroidales bacterium]MDD4214288.1 rhomboid family intramembrane serine protease [Bacteroidales bacterium]
MILIIIAITSVVSIIAMQNHEWFYRLRFNPYLALTSKQWYRFITYGLIHAGWMHLLINMFVLYSFGDVVLQYYVYLFEAKGYYYFALLYVGAIMISVLPSFGKHKNNPYYNAVGASGAVSAVVFASILFAPMGKIYLFFIPFGIPAFIFGVLYLIYSAVMAKRGKDNIGHDAHFWGAVFGIIFTIILKPAIALYFFDQVKTFFGM